MISVLMTFDDGRETTDYYDSFATAMYNGMWDVPSNAVSSKIVDCNGKEYKFRLKGW